MRAIGQPKGVSVEHRTNSRDRRTQTLQSIVYGALQPRRQTNRRPRDNQVYVLDWHDSGLFLLAMSIVVMSCMDAWFTLQLLSIGGEEVNWFMAVLLDNDVSTFLAIKYAVTGAGVIVLVALARFRLGGLLPVRRVLEALVATYACLLIYEVYLLVEVAGQNLIP
jgi:hypothetical protein